MEEVMAEQIKPERAEEIKKEQTDCQPFVHPSDQIMSAEIDKIALALSKAQGQIETALADSENPHFKYKYADLASVWDAMRKPLADNQLALVQSLNSKSGNLTIITTLAHSSGQWFRSKLTLTPAAENAQAFGSCITYGRRYSGAAIVGVAPKGEDDDAEGGVGRAPGTKDTKGKTWKNTGELVSGEYWKLWKGGKKKEANELIGGKDFKALKAEDGKSYIHYSGKGQIKPKADPKKEMTPAQIDKIVTKKLYNFIFAKCGEEPGRMSTMVGNLSKQKYYSLTEEGVTPEQRIKLYKELKKKILEFEGNGDKKQEELPL